MIRRAEEDPKPLYFRESFLDDQLAVFMQERSLEYAAMINPDDFVRWVFPRLLHARLPRYEAIASKFGYTVTTDDISGIRDDADFLDLIAGVLDRQNTH